MLSLCVRATDLITRNQIVTRFLTAVVFLSISTTVQSEEFEREPRDASHEGRWAPVALTVDDVQWPLTDEMKESTVKFIGKNYETTL